MADQWGGAGRYGFLIKCSITAQGLQLQLLTARWLECSALHPRLCFSALPTPHRPRSGDRHQEKGGQWKQSSYRLQASLFMFLDWHVEYQELDQGLIRVKPQIKSEVN
ncbi:hypothetical protein SRHO_G00033100 [Serrasalmus rhombeus]